MPGARDAPGEPSTDLTHPPADTPARDSQLV
jgi:hypothetical protein